MKDFIKKIPGQWKFLAVVLVLYIMAFIASKDFAKMAFGNFLTTFSSVVPIVFVVFIVMFVLNLLLNPEIIKKHLGHDSGMRGWVYTIIGSIVISGPPYVLMPMFADLKKHGMKTALIATFLSNRNVQPVFLPVMAYYFGIRYTIIISLLVVAFSIISGNIVGKLTNE